MAALPGYKQPLDPEILSVAGRGFLPKDYFVRHPVSGFDIAPNRNARHYVPEAGVYPVWSNELGCFDRPVDDGTSVEDMVYLAGDSFTWGYAPFERKFGTILESEIDARVLKCGVVHTGQRQEYVKFKEITGTLGGYPGTVIVNYVSNDFANDYAFPHTTVIEGWQVDNRKLDSEDRIVEIPESELRAQVMSQIAELSGDQTSLKGIVLHYSASAGVIDQMIAKARRTVRTIRRTARRRGDSAERPRANPPPSLVGIYSIERPDSHPFLSELASQNRSAILRWKEDSVRNSYRLIFCLIPPKAAAGDTGWYRDLKAFLAQNDIEYHDFAESEQVAAAGPSVRDFYWKLDGHFSFEGNAAYAEFLKTVLQGPAPAP